MNYRTPLLIAILGLFYGTAEAKAPLVPANLRYSVQPVAELPNVTYNSIVYSLPATRFEIEITATKTTKKVGQFYLYSQRYLGITNAIANDETTYTLTNIRVKPIAIADLSKTYKVSFDSESTAKNLSLTPDGRLLCVNCDNAKNPTQELNVKKEILEKTESTSVIPFSEEMILATTTVKMAEEAAKYIFNLRESRLALISGTAEHPVGSGDALKEALKQIDNLEQQYVALFAGTTSTEKITTTLTFFPEKESKRDLLFRFSKHLGVVDKDNVSGNPVFISVISNNHKLPNELLKPTYDSKGRILVDVPETGFVYRKPSQATIDIFDGNDKIFSNTFNIAQFGQLMSLPKDVISDKNSAIRFCPTSGALLSIEKNKN